MVPPTAVPAASSTSEPRPSGRESTALQSTRSHLAYLVRPDQANAPNRFRTRTLLRTLRYISIFVFWRLVRYAKYALIGSLAAAVAGTAVGSVASGAAFFIAPPGILAGAGVGLLWGLGKFGWRTMARRVRKGQEDGADARTDEEVDAGEKKEKKALVEEREVMGLRPDPW